MILRLWLIGPEDVKLLVGQDHHPLHQQVNGLYHDVTLT